MTAYSDQDLERMLRDLESDMAERKESFKGDAPAKVREAVCAFANDLPDHRKPGVIFIGARDDGSPAGLAVTDELLRQLADMKTDGNIVPPPTLTVEKRLLCGSEMAVVTVWPADSPPARCRGRIWIRVGPRRAIASAQDERILNEKRRHRDAHFDAQPISKATLADLSRARFEEDYLPSAFSPDVLAANDRSYEQRLAATKMILSADTPTPTVAGILVLCVRPRDFIPGAYIQFLRVAGREWGDPIHDEALIEGPIGDLVRRLDEKLAAHNWTAVDFTSGPVESRSATYPMAALQQLVRNAVMHRAYEGTNTPIRVYWFDDRIEIISPGGSYGIVTPESFGQPGVVDYRNPILAEAMRVLGLVQRFGFGIPAARRELREKGHPDPAFLVEATRVQCTVWARRSTVFLSHDSNDKLVVREIAERLKEYGVSPWLDVDGLRPGVPFQAALEEAIRETHAVAVFIGNHGLGWQRPEVHAFLSRMVERGQPVIPVFLPGAPEEPTIGLALPDNTGVDLRAGITQEGLDRLAWGITGKRPNASSSKEKRS